jgi:hypothetical protein
MWWEQMLRRCESRPKKSWPYGFEFESELAGVGLQTNRSIILPRRIEGLVALWYVLELRHGGFVDQIKLVTHNRLLFPLSPKNEKKEVSGTTSDVGNTIPHDLIVDRRGSKYSDFGT